MAELKLKVQYFQDGTPLDIPCREENFIRRELQFSLPVGQTALVLVDLWNVHHIQSWVERAEAMTRNVIGPLIAKARAAGLTIVQAPSPRVTAKYKIYEGRTPPAPGGPEPGWPPPEFRDRQAGYAVFRSPRRQPPGIGLYWDKLDSQIDFSPHVKIEPTDFIIADGRQLHDLCEERRILHLLYAGFATNWCVLGRDYGIVAMRGRGYNTIILRDATEGVEFPDTLAQRWATELAIREVEQRHGFSACSADFHAACDAVLKESK
jgi:nicotinamidase-related amidase